MAPFFLFLWGRRHSEDTGTGAGMGLPVGLLVFELEGLPYLRTGGNGQWMQCLAGMSVLRDGYLVPFRDSSLPLPSIVYDIPGVLASGSGLAASA